MLCTSADLKPLEYPPTLCGLIFLRHPDVKSAAAQRTTYHHLGSPEKELVEALRIALDQVAEFCGRRNEDLEAVPASLNNLFTLTANQLLQTEEVTNSFLDRPQKMIDAYNCGALSMEWLFAEPVTFTKQPTDEEQRNFFASRSAVQKEWRGFSGE